MPVSEKLINRIKEEFGLEWSGIHGYPHWIRVRENGLFLAKTTGANIDIVELFAFLHDSKRDNDGVDADHGRRAADFIKKLQDDLIFLKKENLDLLVFACENHSKGIIEADITVQTCWDADRLDIGRVGIKPTPQNLSTSIAKNQAVIKWAIQRSLK
ncbi:MAG TPA: hypothetical protein VK469_17900 [Candidatus Kapabacteria bacterium]|nr:hypothetical protein [Candidatus Kapabacteria bacterium]